MAPVPILTQVVSPGEVELALADDRTHAWRELAERANYGGGDYTGEVVSLGLASLPHSPTALTAPGGAPAPLDNLGVWLRWLLDAFEDYRAAVEDLDDAEQQRLHLTIAPDVDELDVDSPEPVEACQQLAADELDALLSGPAVEVAA